MKLGGKQGGNTATGLNFEGKVDFLTLLKKIPNYKTIRSSTHACYEVYYLDRLMSMDYIENIAVERLKKVITGEQRGICRAVQWQGGEEFVYCGLAKWNEQEKKQVRLAEIWKH